MDPKPLVMLRKYGQSFWYDNISRGLLGSGELKRMIDEDGLRGVTSNPTIFHKSIQSSNDYDEQLREILSKDDPSAKEVFYALAIQDIVEACELLMPVYEESRGVDGYVSIEVDPHLAYDTEGTIREASELFERIGRPNLMIKVPATKEGVPAVEDLVYRGYNINVTLLFSLKRYEEAVDAYMSGLERRASEGETLAKIASVASFFVSRVDSLTDKYLEETLNRAGDDEQKKIMSLMGKAAVANAKMAYQVFKNAFSSERFLALKERDAGIQRLLWGSTSAKNPAYHDVLYVEELIGPGTVNTMPDATWRAFKDHGRVGRTIDRDVEDAKATIQALEELGISIDRITKELEDEGVRLFTESFDALLDLISEKREVRA